MIEIALPSDDDRKNILNTLFRDQEIEFTEQELQQLVERTKGASNADLTSTYKTAINRLQDQAKKSTYFCLRASKYEPCTMRDANAKKMNYQEIVDPIRLTKDFNTILSSIRVTKLTPEQLERYVL